MVLRLLEVVGGIALIGLSVLMFMHNAVEGDRGQIFKAFIFVLGASFLLKAALHQRGQDKRNLEAFKKIPYADDKRDV